MLSLQRPHNVGCLGDVLRHFGIEELADVRSDGGGEVREHGLDANLTASRA